jgi:hypothetical protein
LPEETEVLLEAPTIKALVLEEEVLAAWVETQVAALPAAAEAELLLL